jgi:DNA ligase 1
VKRFAALLEGLIYTPQRNTKLRLMARYFASTQDPDRGYALAALTGALEFPHAKPATIRALAESRTDPELFRWSYDFVGDLAETVALIWPSAGQSGDGIALTEIVTRIRDCSRQSVPGLLERWFDALDANGRWALIKLIGGGLRVGVSERLAKTALAEFGGKDLARIEEIWHGLTPPYADLFAWLEGRGPEPRIDQRVSFRPMMLAHPLDPADLDALQPEEFRAEWKWDGIRVQFVSVGGERRLFSRTGEDIGPSFPELIAAAPTEMVLDGELLVRSGAALGNFNDLQQRLNRKQPSAALIAKHTAFIRAYDILMEGGEDLRGLGFDARRARLEAWHERHGGDRCFDLSPMVNFNAWTELAQISAEQRPREAEGLMLKRADSQYLPGRPKGHWWKWKRAAQSVDAVLIYAQRGHGRRSSYYSDFTFGCWRDGPEGRELAPVGKAYFGFSDAELTRLDRFVRNHTTGNFGPVRVVEPKLVCELEFDSVRRSTRHKSGVALRFPRIARIRWDKPAAEADAIDALEKMIEA